MLPRVWLVTSQLVRPCQTLDPRSVTHFRRECFSFIASLLESIRKCGSVVGELSKGLGSLCPDLIVNGGNFVFEQFACLTNCLEQSGRLSSLECEGARNEFKSAVVELRRLHGASILETKDVCQFLLGCDTLGCRTNLVLVVRIVALVIDPPPIVMPVVELPPAGVRFPKKVVESSVRSVQSFVSGYGFSSRELLTDNCVEELREWLPRSVEFMSETSVDLWERVRVLPRKPLAEEMSVALTAYLEEVRRRGICGYLQK